MTTVSLSLTFRQLQFVYHNICSRPLFTKINRLSTLVANCQLFPVLQEFATSSNLQNKHRLPLRTVDMRALGVANWSLIQPNEEQATPTLPCTFAGTALWLVFCFAFFGFVFVAFQETDFSEFATLHLVFADRRATARTTTFVEPCSIQTKKKTWITIDSTSCL